MATRALIVGINRYSEPEIANLNGCDDDVRTFERLLESFYGFDKNHITARLNVEHTTKQAIKTDFINLATNADAGDNLIFYFSGHGARIEVKDGVGYVHEEVLCPHDYSKKNSDSYITDDELRKWMGFAARGVKWEVILDCCHSGGMDDIAARNRMSLYVEPFNVRSPETDCVDRKLLKPIMAKHRSSTSDNIHPGTADISLWTACKETDKAYEYQYNGEFEGAFTHFFCETVRAGGGKFAREVILDGVREKLGKMHANDQEPQLYTSEASGVLFS